MSASLYKEAPSPRAREHGSGVRQLLLQPRDDAHHQGGPGQFTGSSAPRCADLPRGALMAPDSHGRRTDGTRSPRPRLSAVEVFSDLMLDKLPGALETISPSGR